MAIRIEFSALFYDENQHFLSDTHQYADNYEYIFFDGGGSGHGMNYGDLYGRGRGEGEFWYTQKYLARNLTTYGPSIFGYENEAIR